MHRTCLGQSVGALQACEPPSFQTPSTRTSLENRPAFATSMHLLLPHILHLWPHDHRIFPFLPTNALLTPTPHRAPQKSSWSCRRKIALLGKSCFVKRFSRTGKTTPRAQISRIRMRCRRKTRSRRRSGSCTARPKRNCQTRSAWRI